MRAFLLAAMEIEILMRIGFILFFRNNSVAEMTQ